MTSANSAFVLEGPQALSSFRAARLLARLQAIEPGVTAVAARFVHYVACNAALDAATQERLRGVLTYGEPYDASFSADIEWLVVPRLGTLSPWASKATDIARNCGLHQVHRVERGTRYALKLKRKGIDAAVAARLAACLHDRMTESVVDVASTPADIFREPQAKPMAHVPLLAQGRAALEHANQDMGLALSDDEVDYLLEAYRTMQRDPSDVELMMFAQANSEHCRHKIFNADWAIDGERQSQSLFSMIRTTHAATPQGTIVAYSDNAAVIEGRVGQRFQPFSSDAAAPTYAARAALTHIVFKVETHNHPTAISPYPGAATGAGGEIRDEGATGRGARPKAGLCGFSVSHLRLPGATRAWENDRDVTQSQNSQEGGDYGFPTRIADALSIMIEGPIGAAAFNNEFGRPNLVGYFRAFEANVGGRRYGYHKPIMIAGGLGNIAADQTHKLDLPPGTLMVQLGGPGMRIGIGGGAASSVGAGSNTEQLDFDSVQRGNAEIQRRAQEVIDRCAALGAENPILSIHDVGAGGLSNAMPELAHGSARGARFELDRIPVEERGMSPLEIWCNESQERYSLALDPARLAVFETLCQRERCPYAVIGTVTQEQQLVLAQKESTPEAAPAVDMPMNVLLGKPPRMFRDVQHVAAPSSDLDLVGLSLEQVALDVLRHPTVASKSFLITIGDRSVGGLNCRDPMVGPWQVPVADCAVTLLDYSGYAGEAMAMGERTPVAVLDAAAAARMAVAEALTNLACADIELEKIKLSANWMAACGEAGEDARLFDAVNAAATLCRSLGVSIPVGKDSLSMRTAWRDDQVAKSVIAPVSLIVSSCAPVADVRRCLTPELRTDVGDTVLLLIDLGAGRNRLGGSILAQVTQQLGREVPDLEQPQQLAAAIRAVRALAASGQLLAVHDRSDGGLFAAVCEMAFAAHCGVTLNVDMLALDPHAADWGDYKIRPQQVAIRRDESTLQALFAEELGFVLQVRAAERDAVLQALREAGLGALSHVVGKPNGNDVIEVWRDAKPVLSQARSSLQQVWSEVSWRIARLRDNPDAADAEYARVIDANDAGLSMQLTFDPSEDIAAPLIATGQRPRIAILREQGVNSQYEMASAFDRAGFSAVDVHMTDLIAGRVSLADFKGLAACGGFSYGDVLGAGGGWAKTILFNARLADMFAAFFGRADTFALGVCNGCQMMSQLASMIPGATHWPRFVTNRSEQFEGRLVMVEVAPSPSLFFNGMAGSRMPIANAHGEGRVEFASERDREQAVVALRYVDSLGQSTEVYPYNPNGSAQGITGLTTPDGRFTILMPHPERVRRTVQMSWQPQRLHPGLQEDSPWMRMFRNARRYLG